MTSIQPVLDAVPNFIVCAQQNPFGALCLLLLAAFIWDIWRRKKKP